MELINYQTIKLQFRENISFLTFNRPESQNAINRQMIDECHTAIDLCLERAVNVILLRGSQEAFCTGADFAELSEHQYDNSEGARLYRLWRRITEEAFVAISQVQGKVTAGGMGFIAASDIVVAEPTASFALSELLFGLFPACVLPFLTRRTGFQKAHYLTITTKPVSAEVAKELGIVDDYGTNSDEIVRRHFLRLGRLSTKAIKKYKQYASKMYGYIDSWETAAVEANREIFLDPDNRRAIANYASKGLFPWESR